MRTASPEFKAQLAVTTTTLCRLWRLTPINGTEMLFTDHDQKIVVGSDVYMPTNSFTSSAIDNSIGGSNVNFDIQVLLNGAIDRADVEQGIYDGASMEIDAIFYDHVEFGTMPLAVGYVTDTSLPTRDLAIMSCAGTIGSSKRILTEVYTPTCRADFGDSRCTLNAMSFAEDFEVTSVNGIFFITNRAGDFADDYFSFGTVIWSTGDNAGKRIEVYRSQADGLVKLLIRPPFPIQVGDTGQITRGCDKRTSTCTAYANLVNYRGEPYIPGQDMLKAPTFSIPPPIAQPPEMPDPEEP